MLEIRGMWLCHMSRWDRYVLRPRMWMETSRSGAVPHIGPYRLSLKVRVGRPNGARERYCAGNDREGTTDVTGVLGPCSYLARVTKARKVKLYQENTRDKVRTRFTLLVTARFDGTTGQAPTLLVVLVDVRC